jgi:hypothetical protein
MKFDLREAIDILERTPLVLRILLSELPDHLIRSNEGGDTWSAYDVIGHLIHGEKTDWIARMRIILHESDKRFVPFDRFAQFRESEGKNLEDLLSEFAAIRKQNVDILKSYRLSESQLSMKGIHPQFGDVTLKELLVTWAVHDLTHINQISRVIAKQFKDEVGPWIQYLGVLNR